MHDQEDGLSVSSYRVLAVVFCKRTSGNQGHPWRGERQESHFLTCSMQLVYCCRIRPCLECQRTTLAAASQTDAQNAAEHAPELDDR
jgi:hypothetical protein